MDEKFLQAIEEVKSYGISINNDLLEKLYKAVRFYQTADYPLWLLVRELGGASRDLTTSERTPFSDDCATIVLEQYFSNYTTGLSFIFSELQRISKGNTDCSVVKEDAYEEGAGLTIEYTVNGKTFSSTHTDEYEDGTLMYDFVKDQLIPNLEGAVRSGTILYYGDEYFTFVYLQEAAKAEELKAKLKGADSI